jgi:hypothetical protein
MLWVSHLWLVTLNMCSYDGVLNKITYIRFQSIKYSKHSSNTGVRFLESDMLGKSKLDKLNALWVKWEYVNAAA